VEQYGGLFGSCAITDAVGGTAMPEILQSQSRSGSDYRRPLVFNIILTDTNLRKKDASIIRRVAFDMRLSDPTK
jgi:hypothetical protein